jgi:glycosyltransferase involved in cell wall biosynthesis
MADGDKLRVLIVISNLEHGGAQRRAIELANHFDEALVDVHLCSLSPSVPMANALKHRDCMLSVVHKRFRYDLTVVPRLAQLARRRKVQVMQSFLFDADIAVRLAGVLAATPLVVNAETMSHYHVKRMQRWAACATRQLADLVVSNSQAGARHHAAQFGHGAAAYRLVYNGVDCVRFQPRDAAEARRALRLPPDAPVVGIFATFRPEKDHELFLDAAERVVQGRPATRLLLVGDEFSDGRLGSRRCKQSIERRIGELGWGDRVLMLGNRNDVEWLYPACDLTVLSSSSEGTPNAALESMACGVPVVVTDVGDSARVVLDGRTGFVVPPGDPIALAHHVLALLDDRPLRERMGAAARCWTAEQFSSQRQASCTEQVYRQALAARRG